MILSRPFLTATLLLIASACCLTARSQTVKDVMQDKSGTYIYAQSRDSDISVAFDMASKELLYKITDFCKTNGLQPPAGAIPESSGFIQRINGEAYGQHRVFLYVTTASLRNIPSPQAEPQPAPEPEPEPIAIPEPEPAPAPAPAPAPLPEPEPEPAPAPAPAPVIEAAPVATAALPPGRIGDIVATLLSQTSVQGVLSVLEKEKNARGLSRYGREQTKFMPHCYVITVLNKRVHVYSPLGSNRLRTDYASGLEEAEPAGTMLFWFLK